MSPTARTGLPASIRRASVAGGLRLQLELALFESRRWARPRARTRGSPSRRRARPAPRRGDAPGADPALAARPPVTRQPGLNPRRPRLPPRRRSTPRPEPSALARGEPRPRRRSPGRRTRSAGARPHPSPGGSTTPGDPGDGRRRLDPRHARRHPIDLERLRHGWAEVVAALSSAPALKPMINACRPITVEGNVVTLGFPEEKTSCATWPTGRSAPASRP